MEKNRKTALFIHHGATLGGAPLSLLEILKRIDRKRTRPVVVSPEEGPFSDLLQKEEIEYRIIPLFTFYYCSQAKSFSARSLPLFFISVKRALILFIKALGNIIYLPVILKKENPDVVIINTSTPLLCGVIAKLMGRRVIWHIREVISTERSRILKKIIASIIRFSAEKVIVASEYSLRDVSDLGLKNSAAIYEGAVDLKKFRKKDVREADFKQFGLNAKNKIVGFVGQIYGEKGWKNLVKAAFLLIEKLPHIKFLIIGNSYMINRIGDERKDLPKNLGEDMLFHKIVKEMNLCGNFIFLGQRFDTENILPLMDCLVFTSIVPEVFGRVMIEAMACGVPVVASNIGASSEIVENNITGLLVPPDNPMALRDALIDILTDEEKAGKMGNAGRRRVEELFDIENIIPGLLDIYKI